MALQRVHQEYELPDGSRGTVWKGVTPRGGRPRYHAVVVLRDLVLLNEPADGFATWEQAEAWMHGQVEEVHGV